MTVKTQKKKLSTGRLSLETRIISAFALMEIAKTDVKNISEEDFKEIFEKVKELNEMAFEQDDMKAFDLVEKYNLDEISDITALKERIARNRVTNIYKQLGFFSLSKGETTEYTLSSAQILATMMHEVGIKNADEIAEKIVEGRLTEDEAEALHSNLSNCFGNLKKRLVQDFQIYNDQGYKNPYIELVRGDIEEYTFDKNKKLEIKYSVPKSKKPFRDVLRDNFNTGTKPEFLKLYGTMLIEGRNASKNVGLASNYEQFCKNLSSYLGDIDIKTVIDEALGVSTQNLDDKKAEEARRKAYQEKCKELYFKTVAGLLSQKYEYNRTHGVSTDYDVYLQTIDNKYIKALSEGKNEIEMLAFQDPDYKRQFESKAAERKLNKELRDETAEMQIVSIHHKFPISATYDVCDKIIPNCDEDLKLKKCNKLANNFSNIMYVIGQEVHQSLEANGIMSFGANQDCAIFAADVDCEALMRISRNFPPFMIQGFREHLKLKGGEKKKRITSIMKFPEPEEICSVRQILGKENKHVSTLHKFKRYLRETQ